MTNQSNSANQNQNKNQTSSEKANPKAADQKNSSASTDNKRDGERTAGQDKAKTTTTPTDRNQQSKTPIASSTPQKTR